MERTSVSSSNIRAIGYEAETRTPLKLNSSTVVFTSTQAYRSMSAEAIMSADSKGRYLPLRNIKALIVLHQAVSRMRSSPRLA